MSTGAKGWSVFGRKDAHASALGADPAAPDDGHGPEEWPAESSHPEPVQSGAGAPLEGDSSQEDILRLLYPQTYEAVRVVRAHAEASVIFVPSEGMPFSYPYSYCSGVRPLPGGEGLAIAFPGEVVEIRGQHLHKVFFEISGHRAHIVRAWRGEWGRRPPDRVAIRSIVPKPVDASEPEGEGP